MSNRTAIPAQPGFVLLQFQLGGDQLDRLPIIGWVVGLDCGLPANPITVRGTENVWDIRSAVMSPDGFVVDCIENETVHGSIEDWLVSVRRGVKVEAAE